MKPPRYQIRPNERLVSGLIYLSGLLPLWGILVAWITRESWRERSRHVVFHTTQLIWFQAGVLGAFVAYTVVRVMCDILDVIHQPLSALFRTANDWILLSVAVIYAVTCLAAAWMAMDGRSVSLPLIGRRIHDQEFGDSAE